MQRYVVRDKNFLILLPLVSIKVPGEPGYRVVKLLSVDPDNYDDAPREVFTAIL